jgi:hypothetical protein
VRVAEQRNEVAAKREYYRREKRELLGGRAIMALCNAVR